MGLQVRTNKFVDVCSRRSRQHVGIKTWIVLAEGSQLAEQHKVMKKFKAMDGELRLLPEPLGTFGIPTHTQYTIL